MPSDPAIMLAARRARQVPVGPLRDAFLATGRSAGSVAMALNWKCTVRKPGRAPRECFDGPRVKRTLGLKPYKPRAGYPKRLRETVTYAMAERLARAIGVDPHEVGL
jgi:hypothetical protein